MFFLRSARFVALLLHIACLSQTIVESVASSDMDALCQLDLSGARLDKKILEAEQKFAIDMTKQLMRTKVDENGELVMATAENIFLSPASIFQALLLLYVGAEDKTERELAPIIGVEDIDDIGKRKQRVASHLLKEQVDTSQSSDDLEYTLRLVSRMYFNTDFVLHNCVQSLMSNIVKMKNFKTAPEETRKEINADVSGVTDGKIPELLQVGTVDGTTNAAFVNAALFDGKWKSAFLKNDTKPQLFYVTMTDLRFTPFMTQRGDFNLFSSETLKADVLELPYKGDRHSMLILLPQFEKTSIARTANELSIGFLDELADARQLNLEVKLPRFKISKSYRLENELAKLSFPSIDNANVDGFLSNEFKSQPDAESIRVKNFIHKTYIDVNEAGSKAAAASAALSFRSARFDRTSFEANHPFIYFIFDKEVNKILFIGLFQNPDDRDMSEDGE